jgi:NADH:ubiquinone oxidoreductase subunit B-like Fe-S oxidoreductase
MTVAQKTTVSRLVHWARAKSLWIFPFGEGACTVERTASIAAPGDLERWGVQGCGSVPCPSRLTCFCSAAESR